MKSEGIENPPCPCRYLPSKGFFVTSRKYHASFTVRTTVLYIYHVLLEEYPHAAASSDGSVRFFTTLKVNVPLLHSTNAQQESWLVFFTLVGRPHSGTMLAFAGKIVSNCSSSNIGIIPFSS